MVNMSSLPSWPTSTSGNSPTASTQGLESSATDLADKSMRECKPAVLSREAKPIGIQLKSSSAEASTPAVATPIHFDVSAANDFFSSTYLEIVAGSQFYSPPSTKTNLTDSSLSHRFTFDSAWQFSQDVTEKQVTRFNSAPTSPTSRVYTMAPVDLHAMSEATRGSSLTPPLHGNIPVGEMVALQLSASCLEPENEPMEHPVSVEKTNGALTDEVLPATFLQTVCDQLEYYFCDENLLGDLFLLKNMNMEGYVKLELLASFGRVKRLTTDMDQIKQALELSTKLLMNEDETMVCRKDPLPADQTYHGKLARTAVAYNLPEQASVASLRETFQGCGEITYLRLLKKNTTTGRNAVLKPPIQAGETYAIIEFVDEEMTKHAVLTLSDQYNWRTGMQVVLFDGTNVDKLKQKMFPVDIVDRRRAKSTSAVPRPVHVDAVGEGLDSLKEGKVSTGTVYSIRGAGGLITPTRLENACISFRLVPDEDGNMDIRQGDYVSFTVGKNKKSGRKYASKVKLEFRPPSSLTGATNNSTAAEPERDYFASTPSRWEGRSRASTVGAPPAPLPHVFRGRSGTTGARPKLNLSTSPRSNSSVGNSAAANGYRQALGPDGTRGFGARRQGTATASVSGTGVPLMPEFSTTSKWEMPTRGRSFSSTPALERSF